MSAEALLSGAWLTLCGTDLHDWFPIPKKRECVWECFAEQTLQPGIRHVAASEPEHLRRCVVPANQIDKVLVFREQDGTLGASAIEDVPILRLTQVEITNVDALY